MIKPNELIDVNFKDNSPEKTVNIIKNILESNNIKVNEVWIESNVPNCYSLKLELDGIKFYTSGKGVTRELALASAYGEFMERVQLGFIGRRSTAKDGMFSMNDSQDIKISKEEILKGDMDLYQKQSDRLYEWNGNRITPLEILEQYVDNDGNVLVTPFISLVSGKTVYVPAQMRKAVYTSNGCAAGNSIEEAMVQSIGEIFERYYRIQVIQENVPMPDIPEEVLKQYSVAYDIITYIRSKGYKVTVKDCSLGTRFPVVCICFVQIATGKYHTHFGACPVFEIALTRALTETFQGVSINSLQPQFDDFIYNDEAMNANLAYELTYGSSKRTPDFFDKNLKYTYNPNVGFKGENNKELLKECVEFLAEQGYDVLARDASSLGFPTCQIIVPGYSETYIHRISQKTNENKYLSYAVSALRDLSKATIDDMIGVLMHDKTIKEHIIAHPNGPGFLLYTKLLAQISVAEEKFFMAASMAYIYYALGQYKEMQKNIDKMIAINNGEKEELLLCIKRYFELLQKGYSKEQIKNILEFLHTSETLEMLYSYVDENKNPFEEFILHCDLKCSDSCVLKEKCCNKKAQELMALIEKKTKELNFEKFSESVKKLIS